MAQIEQSDGGKKKKGAQKKIAIHVDFTPMVDMNMLLITFFMLCTTMIKSQTLSIALPAPPEENRTAENSEEVHEEEALTLIIDTERDADGTIQENADGKIKDVIYYYEGFEPVIENDVVKEDKLKAEQFLGNTQNGKTTVYNGIRNILHKKNKDVLTEIEGYKADWRAGKMSDSIFEIKAREARNNEKYFRPKVTIKATDNAAWQSVISALDEMQINQISQYRIGTMTHNDSLLILDYKTRNGIK
jgi:biopolymer transport protein ExbD